MGEHVGDGEEGVEGEEENGEMEIEMGMEERKEERGGGGDEAIIVDSW